MAVCYMWQIPYLQVAQNQKHINVPDPKAQIWGNLLLGPYFQDQGVLLPRIHLFLYSKRKQNFNIT